MPTRKEVLEIDGREVTVTNPDKIYFPDSGYTKMDLVHYYLAVSESCSESRPAIALPTVTRA